MDLPMSGHSECLTTTPSEATMLKNWTIGPAKRACVFHPLVSQWSSIIALLTFS